MINKISFLLTPLFTVGFAIIILKWFPLCCDCPPKHYEYKILYGVGRTVPVAVSGLRDSVSFYLNQNTGWDIYASVGGGSRVAPTNLEEIPGGCPACEVFVTSVLRRPK